MPRKEYKTITGNISTPSELLDVPILVSGVISAKDKNERIGVKDFQQIINLTNMSSYEKPIDTIHLDLPLKQFRLGISTNNVTCKTEFQLVLKSEDVTLTDSFRDKVSQNVIRVVELSKGPDGSITDSDEDMIGRAVVLTLCKDYGISNRKEVYEMTDLVINILGIKAGP